MGQSAARPDRSFIQMRQKFRANHSAERQINCHQNSPTPRPTVKNRLSDRPIHTLSVARREQWIRGFSHSSPPRRNNRLAKTGAITIEKRQRTGSAKATVQAIGRKSLPSTRLQRVDWQIGRDDDGDGIENRALHFMARLADDFCMAVRRSPFPGRPDAG